MPRLRQMLDNLLQRLRREHVPRSVQRHRMLLILPVHHAVQKIGRRRYGGQQQALRLQRRRERQTEPVIARLTQAAAEADYAGLTDRAARGQLRDGHMNHLVAVGQHKIGNIPFHCRIGRIARSKGGQQLYTHR